MNWAWWDGKMSYEHYREEHGLDSETLLAAARPEVATQAGAQLVARTHLRSNTAILRPMKW